MQLILQDTPFVGAAVPAGQPIHQQPIWADLCKSEETQAFVYFRADHADRMLATGVMRMRRMPAGLSVASLQRGPAVADPADLAILLPQLEEEARARGAVTLSVNPHFTGGSAARAAAILRGMGYLPVSEDLQSFPTATQVLDLNRNDDALLIGMTDSCRRVLRAGRSAGAVVRRMETRAEAEIATELMADMLAQKGCAAEPQHNFVRHHQHLSEIPDAGVALVATQKGEIHGAAVSYAEGTRGYNILMATRDDSRVPMSNLLIWESARVMRDMGCSHLELVGDVILPGDTAAHDAVKQSFGSDAIKVLPVFAKPLRQGLHQLANTLRLLRRKL